MMFASPKLRPLLKWHGGKSYLCRKIIARFRPHRTYVEPYAGGLSIALNKFRAEVEVANDLNADLIGCYKTLVGDQTGEFREALRRLRYSQATFEQAGDGTLPVPDHLRRAASFVVRNRMSRGGLGRDFAWSDRLRGGRPGDENGWMTILDQLDVIRDRLLGVRFYNQHAIDVIQGFDAPKTLHYIDPTYLHATRTATAAYAHEMSDTDHEALLEVILRCRGQIFLSGYHSPLYDRLLARWQCIEIPMPLHAGQGKVKKYKIECLWIKPS